jgi:GNAT superfamily N-acetyltransferase
VQRSELVEREAVRSFYEAAAGARQLQIGSAVCIALPAVPVPMLNRTVGLGEDDPATDAELDAIEGFFNETAVRHYVSVTPASRPPDIRDRLRRRGYTPGYNWMKFVRPAATSLSETRTELEVRFVDRGGAGDFASVVVEGYDLPDGVSGAIGSVAGLEGWSCYVAYDGSEPAAAGAVFIHERAAWLGLAATVPDHRRKGGQGALLATRIGRAAELGCDLVVTETGVRDGERPSTSYRNLLRSGFEEAYVRENYLAPERSMAVR